MITIKNIMAQVEAEASTNGKIAILEANKDNETLQEVLYYTYNPELKYKLTIPQLRLKADGRKSKWNDVFKMLDELSESNINNELRAEVLAFLEANDEHREFFTRMLTKDFKNGVKTKTVNKVWKGLIPTFDVQRAESNAKLKLKKDEEFVLMMKENGSRGTYYNGKLMTRQGKVHKQMAHIEEQIKEVFGSDYIIDGELVCFLEEGMGDNERLRKTISILNSDDYSEDKLKIEMKIFDIVSKKEFVSEEFKATFISDRLPLLKSFGDKLNKTTHLSICEILYEGSNQDKIQELLDETDAKGLEGLVLYKDSAYKKGKTTSVLKIKSFIYSDLKIKGFFLGEVGTRLENGFGGFVVDYKGFDVRVGGGYTDEDRKAFGVAPEDYIGQILEVKYKGESKNERGGKSLQFPVAMRIREEGKEVSYES
jgi:DNA ligase-1